MKSGSAVGRVQPKSRLRDSSEAAAIHADKLAAQGTRALHTTIHDSKLPTKSIAHLAGVSYQFLASCALESTTDTLPWRRLFAVLEACDDLTFVAFLASLQRSAVYRLPEISGVGDPRQTATVMREFAEFLQAGAAALDDGQVTPEEFARIEREGHDVVRAVLETIAMFGARVQRPLLEGM